MNKPKKPIIRCKGQPLLNPKGMGGCIEDYICDPERKPNYPANMRWIPVGQSFSNK